jgi:hypothetical protein
VAHGRGGQSGSAEPQGFAIDQRTASHAHLHGDVDQTHHGPVRHHRVRKTTEHDHAAVNVGFGGGDLRLVLLEVRYQVADGDGHDNAGKKCRGVGPDGVVFTHTSMISSTSLTTPNKRKFKAKSLHKALYKPRCLCFRCSSFHMVSSFSPKMLDLCSSRGRKRSSSVSPDLNPRKKIGNMYLEGKRKRFRFNPVGDICEIFFFSRLGNARLTNEMWWHDLIQFGRHMHFSFNQSTRV